LASRRSPYYSHTPTIYFPYFTIIELIGYLGWIKVSEALLNPWGDDDEDFQINYLIDRNFQVSSYSPNIFKFNIYIFMKQKGRIFNYNTKTKVSPKAKVHNWGS